MSNGLVQLLHKGEDDGSQAVIETMERIGLLAWNPVDETYVVRMERGTRISHEAIRRQVRDQLGRRP